MKNNGCLIVSLITNLFHIKNILAAHFYHHCLNYKWKSSQIIWIPNIELFFTVEREAKNSLSFLDTNFFRDTGKKFIESSYLFVFWLILIVADRYFANILLFLLWCIAVLSFVLSTELCMVNLKIKIKFSEVTCFLKFCWSVYKNVFS